jgi:hypothetical protein
LVAVIIKRYRNHADTTPPVEKTVNIVRCAVCSVHSPESEAIKSEGQYYCCESHFLQRKKD